MVGAGGCSGKGQSGFEFQGEDLDVEYRYRVQMEMRCCHAYAKRPNSCARINIFGFKNRSQLSLPNSFLVLLSSGHGLGSEE